MFRLELPEKTENGRLYVFNVWSRKSVLDYFFASEYFILNFDNISVLLSYEDLDESRVTENNDFALERDLI